LIDDAVAGLDNVATGKAKDARSVIASIKRRRNA